MSAFALALLTAALPSAGTPAARHDGKTLAEWVALMNGKPASHAAVHALGELGEPAIPHLVKAMRSHRDGAIRWLSHVALARIGRPALPHLDKIMVDGDTGARIQAVLSFEKILGQEAIPRLRKATADPAPQVQARACGALLRLGDAPRERLQAMVEILRTRPGAAWIAAEALGMCAKQAAGAEAALAHVVEHGRGSVADRALRALEQIGTPEAMMHYNKEMARRLRKPGARAAKLRAIVRLARAGKGAVSACPMLHAIASDRKTDLLLRAYAAWAAEQLEPAQSKPVTYHVAQRHAHASDANPGTAAKPWRTVQKAAESLRPGDTVLIHDGVYRECVRPFVGGASAERMVTYRAAPGARPVLTASDPWRPRWRREGERLWSAPYTRHPWDAPEKWPNPRQGAMHRAEQVFVDGKLLVHVDTPKQLAAAPGRMRTDDKAGRLWVHLDGERKPGEREVERAMRQQAFAPAVRGLGYIRVQGLTLRHGAAPECNGACWHAHGHRAVLSVRAGHHWVIEDNTIEWGNAQGLDIGGEGWSPDLRAQPIVSERGGWHQVRRNRVSFHGVAGIVGWGGRQQFLLLEDNQTHYNCQKGNLYQYESAGVKLHNAQDCVIRRHRSHGNHAFGIWLDHKCLRNRITQCILTENAGAGFFFEVSAGPLLVDNNVILGTRDASRGNWGEGVYSHDGNRATYVNNFIQGCRGHGVRIRNLFARIAGGKPTTTSHNRVVNNFIFDNARAEVSFNPEVPRAEDNHSDHNVLWHDGGPIVMRLDPGGAKIDWARTAVGKALGQSGRRLLTVPLDVWRASVGEDRHSLVLPASLLFGAHSPEQIRDALTRLWPADAPALDGAYGEVKPQPAAALVGALCAELKGAALVCSVYIGPRSGVQIWRTGAGLRTLRWSGAAKPQFADAPSPVLAGRPSPPPDPVKLAVGDTARVRVARGSRVAFSALKARVSGDQLAVGADDDTPPGEYAVVLVSERSWRRVPVRVAAAYGLAAVEPDRSDGQAVRVAIENHRTAPVEANVTVRIGDDRSSAKATLKPRCTTTVRVPVTLETVGEADVSVTLPGATLAEKRVISFARAVRSGRPPVYPIDGFPGGSFPAGADAFALFGGGLAARWSASYDARALSLDVEVDDKTHLQEQARNRLWKQDSVQLLLRARDGKPLALDVALRSDTHQVSSHRCRWPSSAGVPGPSPKGLSAHAERVGRQTRYR